MSKCKSKENLRIEAQDSPYVEVKKKENLAKKKKKLQPARKENKSTIIIEEHVLRRA